MDRKCKNCYNPLTLGQTECPNCGTLNYLPTGATNEQGVTLSYTNNPNDYPMRWFKFVIYVQLFLNGILNLFIGINTINGLQWLQSGVELDQVYGVFPALKTADTTYGVLLIFLAVFAIIIRFRLAGFHQDGPILYLLLFVAHIVSSFVYAGMTISAIDSATRINAASVWAEALSNSIPNLVLLICNFIYFRKRRHLFIY